MTKLVERQPWPPVTFAVEPPSISDTFLALYVIVEDEETHETMWLASPEGTRSGGAVMHRPRAARMLDPASEEAAQARREFDEALLVLAAARGYPIREITYGNAPVGLTSDESAKPLISGRTYHLRIIGTGRLSTLFQAP